VTAETTAARLPAAGEHDPAGRFLQAFQEIEQHLRAALLAPDSEDFSKVLKLAVDSYPGVRRYQHELRQFAMLRNAIVHRPSRGGQPIADPRPDVVLQIQSIRTALLEAPSLISVLGPGVKVATADSSIRSASKVMLGGDYSQLPVLSDGRVVDLLTNDAIARWMTTELETRGDVRLDVPVIDIAPFDADRSYEVVDRSSTVVKALDLFARHQEVRGEMLHAILVSKWLPDGPLVAIATVTDLPSIMRAAEPYRWSEKQ
jgi:hypothetical protein